MTVQTSGRRVGLSNLQRANLVSNMLADGVEAAAAEGRVQGLLLQAQYQLFKNAAPGSEWESWVRRVYWERVLLAFVSDDCGRDADIERPLPLIDKSVVVLVAEALAASGYAQALDRDVYDTPERRAWAVLDGVRVAGALDCWHKVDVAALMLALVGALES